jgi:hypothetical protein
MGKIVGMIRRQLLIFFMLRVLGMIGRLVALKPHLDQIVLRINRGTDLRRHPPLLKRGEFGFVLLKDQGSKFSFQYYIMSSCGQVGWVFADDVQEIL